MTSTNSNSNQDYKAYMQRLENTLDLYLVKKAPALPQSAKDILVKIAPWLAIISVVISIPAILAIFGLSAFMMPFAGLSYGPFHMISVIVLAIAVILEALAIPGLMNRTKQGWTYFYYSALVSAVSALVGFDIFGAVIGFLITMYILFQIRSAYK